MCLMPMSVCGIRATVTFLLTFVALWTHAVSSKFFAFALSSEIKGVCEFASVSLLA